MAVTINKNALQRIASFQLQGKNGYEEDLRKLLAGDVATIEKWGMPLTSTDRQDRNNAIFDHWLAGETTTQIAGKVHLPRQHIDRIITDARIAKREAMCITEQPPHLNVWNYALCDPRFGQELETPTGITLKLKDHPGRIPGQAIINLLLWLTDPFDVVVDPMAGGGTTIDVCRYLLRRYYCFDIDPRRPDIKQWDIRGGYPRLPQKPGFILLDPPYWRLKRDEYSQDGAAMTSYEEWLRFMQKLAKDSYNTLKEGGYVALFIESFLDERETGKFLFLNRDCLNLFEVCGFEGIQEISLNMPSQIKSFRDVTYAKKKQILLDLKREVFVFRKRRRGNAPG